MQLLEIVPVIPTADMKRDIKWYEEKTGFTYAFGDEMYAGIKRGQLMIHLQWHADTTEDPLNGGSVIRIFVRDIDALFEEFVKRGTVASDKLQKNTPWGTHEFGFFDPNKNAIFFVEDV